MSSYLLSAIEKFNSDKSVNFDLPMEDFLCQCYITLTPNAYGSKIEDWIIDELNATSVKPSLEMGDFEYLRKYFEFKVSFLTRKNTFNITHIRPWQLFNYYLLCFVDCEDNFKPHYYVLDKHVIHKMKLSYMNGTPKSNRDNHNVEMRKTIKKDSIEMNVIKRSNLLEDTSLDSVKKFMETL